MADPFDFEAQKAETFAIWAEMSAQNTLPERGRVDLNFVPGDAPDATEFMGWLEDHGFEVEHYPAQDDETETLEAQTEAMTLSAQAIHEVERRATQAALTYGYRPDGWGFMGV